MKLDKELRDKSFQSKLKKKDEDVPIHKATPSYGRAFPKDEEDVQTIVDRTLVNRDSINRNKVAKPVQTLEVLTEDATINGRVFKRVFIYFTNDSDPNFDGANVWLKGYGTGDELGQNAGKENTLPFTLFARITQSPATIILEKSSESVIIGVEAFNSEGRSSGLSTMPTFTFDLT